MKAKKRPIQLFKKKKNVFCVSGWGSLKAFFFFFMSLANRTEGNSKVGGCRIKSSVNLSYNTEGL